MILDDCDQAAPIDTAPTALGILEEEQGQDQPDHSRMTQRGKLDPLSRAAGAVHIPEERAQTLPHAQGQRVPDPKA